MFDQPSPLSREGHLAIALVSVVFVFGCVLLAGTEHLGIADCPTCAVYDSGLHVDCSGTQLTYCGGGLPLLVALISSLTGLSFLFGLNATLASSRQREKSLGPRIARPKSVRPITRSITALTLLSEGAGLAGMGALMPLPIFEFCPEPCGAYPLSPIPVALVVIGGMMLGLAGVLLAIGRRPSR